MKPIQQLQRSRFGTQQYCLGLYGVISGDFRDVGCTQHSNKLDLQWFAKGGGIVGNAHPSARKFNGGQKLIFWMTIILGASVSMSGLSLLFPFELPMFAKTFGMINTILPAMGLPTELLPHEEMQLAHLWHAIVAITMIIAIVAHIYIGSVGWKVHSTRWATARSILNGHASITICGLKRKPKVLDSTSWRCTMKTMLAAFAFTAVVSVGAYFVLSEMGFSSAEVQSAPSVRLD